MTPFLHAFIVLMALPLLLAAVVQRWAARYAADAAVTNWLGLLPVLATALLLALIIAFVVPRLGLATGAVRQALPVHLLFALFGFFVELVPYLPSFGGYIRYGVGVVLTYFGGRALLRWLQAYLERKKQEQAASQEERKESIHYEAALTSLARNQCPSCDRPLILQNGATPAFCMHCGLQLLSSCPSCGLRKNAFYHYCPDCGEPAETSKS